MERGEVGNYILGRLNCSSAMCLERFHMTAELTLSAPVGRGILTQRVPATGIASHPRDTPVGSSKGSTRQINLIGVASHPRDAPVGM